MRLLTTTLFLLIATISFSQSRGGDCKCYQGDVLEDGQEQVIIVQPARTVTRIEPATFETKPVRILIQPATTTSDDNCPTCVVEVPAIYETIQVTTELTPEKLVVETIPAVTRVVPTKYVKYEGRFVTRPANECK